MAKIRSCIKCKYIPTVLTYTYVNTNKEELTLYGIHCKKCKKHMRTKLYSNREDAINEWNKTNTPWYILDHVNNSGDRDSNARSSR